MTARLVLLMGPAAEDVAQVFSDDCHCCCPDGDPHRRWDEVRDYSAAPIAICQASAEGDWMGEGPTCCDRVEAAIHSLPAGEAWLVGLVLPDLKETKRQSRLHFTDWASYHAQHRAARIDSLPARLAILAPEPPPLLVERVRAWGGVVWWCSVDEHEGSWARIDPTPARVARDCLAAARTWPEAVRAALGEVAP